MATPTITPDAGAAPSTPATPATPSTPAATPSQPAHSSDRALANFTGTDPDKGGVAKPAAAAPAASTPAAATTDPAAAATVPDGLTSLLDDLIEKPDAAAAAAATTDPAAAATTDPADPLAALKDNPRVQELVKAEETVKGLLTKSEWVKEPAHIEAAIADAHVLWDISEGKQKIDVILEAAKQVNPERHKAILADLKTYLESQGVQVAAPAAVDPANMTPEQKRLAAVEKELADSKKAEADRKAADAQAAQVKRITATKTAVIGKITELLKDTPFDGEAERFFALAGPIIGQEKVNQLIDAVEKGDFKLVEMAVKKAQSAEATRLKLVIDRLIALQKKKGATIPLQSSGNSPAAGSEPAAATSITDKEARRKKMIESLRT